LLSVRPRQARYHAALRPDMKCNIDSKALPNFAATPIPCIELANGSPLRLLPSRAQQLAVSNCLVNDHPRDRLAILFLFRCV